MLSDIKGRIRKTQINFVGLWVLLVIAVAWQAGSTQLPRFLFPPLQDIAAYSLRLFTDTNFYATTALTYARIILSVSLSFAIFVTAGILAGLYAPIAKGASPVFVLIQGIPAICWTIFAILWFKNNEVRVAFIVCVSTGASFFFQLRDAVLAIPADLRDMTLAWRPTHLQLIGKLVLPAVFPVMLTTTLVNLGMGVKVGVTAELLASASGIGNELRDAQELFRVDQVIGWTVPLVIFVLLIEYVSAWANRRYLAWRPTQERAA